MRTVLLLFASFFIYFSCLSQNNLSGSRKTSVYTYIYKINKQEANTLYNSGMSKVSEKYLHSLADSSKAGDDIPKLIAGDYLFTYAKDNRLVFEFHSEGDVECKLINNNRDL